jgi:xanthine dehydrogenase YagS FAD-binding subunit
MKNFTYYRPSSPEQAVGLLDGRWGTSELLGGGTDLLDLQKEYIVQPDKVVSLSGLPRSFREVAILERFPPIFVIGGGTTIADLAGSKDVQKWLPGLAQAAKDVGGPQIRHMGTIGGNLCQRNRCWYFRDEFVHCLLKGGDKCLALDGENRHHAIFTAGHKCVMVHPSTVAPALIALGATAEVLGPGEKRTVPLAKFFQAPSTVKDREHTLAPNEMVLSVKVEAVNGQKSASYEIRHKQSYDWPLAQAAVAFQLEGGKAKNVRIVLGHVAPTPHVSESAAKAIEGKAINEETAAAAGEAAGQGAKPLGQNAYKVKLAGVAVKRALLLAVGHEKYWEVREG